MTSLLFFILAFGFLPSSPEEDKEKNELQNQAETAFSKNDFGKANEVYLELLEKIDRKAIDWQTYVDIVLRAAETHLFLKQYENGIELLTKVLEEKPPKEFLPKVSLLLAKFYSFDEKAGLGYLQMKEVMKIIPFENWRPDEKAFFRTLENALHSYYEGLLQKAAAFNKVENYFEARNAYKTVLEAIDKGFFFKAVADPFIKRKISLKLKSCEFELAFIERSKEAKELLSLATALHLEKQEFEQWLLEQDFNTFHYESTLFEIGNFYYQRNHLPQAKLFLEKLVLNKENVSRPMLIGALILGKIYLAERHLKEAGSLFHMVEMNFPKTDQICIEATHLLGEVHFLRKDFCAAIPYFELSLSNQKTSNSLATEGLIRLALCYAYSNNEKGIKLLEKLKTIDSEGKETYALALAELKAGNFKKVEALLGVSDTQAELLLDDSLEKQILAAIAEENLFNLLTLIKNYDGSWLSQFPHFEKVYELTQK